MKLKFGEFYKFVQCFNPTICDIWEDFHNRPDPQYGDKFMIKNELASMGEKSYLEATFDKVIFDDKYKNGVAFYYIFNTEDNDKIKIHSINNIYDMSNLTINEHNDFMRFWKQCSPIN